MTETYVYILTLVLGVVLITIGTGFMTTTYSLFLEEQVRSLINQHEREEEMRCLYHSTILQYTVKSVVLQ